MSRDGSTRVYIGDLGSGGSKPELEREFERYGSLKSVWVARNPPGFAFIEFEDPRDAEDAVRDMDGRYVCGVRIKCEMARNSSRYSGDERPGGRSFNRRGAPPRIVSSRYRRTPPRNRSRSPPSYRRSRSRSGSPKRSRSRSPQNRRYGGRRSPSPYNNRRSPSPTYNRENRDRD